MAHSEEIARLEHELAELRSHYAQLERNGRMTKQGEKFFLAVIAVLLGYLLWTDFVAGAFALTMATAVGALVWFTRSREFDGSMRERQWANLMSARVRRQK